MDSTVNIHLFDRPGPPSPRRSWSDERIDVNHHPNDPVTRSTARSSSFSVSRAPQPQWDKSFTPPVPPLPPSLMPRSHGPTLAHTNRDLSFMEPPRPHPLRGQSSTSFIPNAVSTPNHIPVPHPPDTPRFHMNSSSDYALPPVPPPKPTPGPVSNAPGVVYRQPSVYQNTPFSSNHSPSIVPPHLPTSHDEIPSRRSSSLHSLHLPPPARAPTPPPPPLPPKPLMSSANVERTIGAVSSSFITPPNDCASEKADPYVETDDPSLHSDLKRALTLSLMESQRQAVMGRTLEDEDNDLNRAIAESLSLSLKLKSEYDGVPNPSFSETATTHDKSEPDEDVKPPPKESRNMSHTQHSSQLERMPSKPRFPVPLPDVLSPEELEDHQARGQIIQELEDKEVMKRLQGEEEQRHLLEIKERERQEAERMKQDEEITKRLQEEETRRLEAEKLRRERQDEEDEELARRQAREEKAMKLIREAQERKDAEMARMLAEGGQRPRRKSANATAPGAKKAPSQPTPDAAKEGPSPPKYSDVMRTRSVPSAGLSSSSEPKGASPPGPPRSPRLASTDMTAPTAQPAEPSEVARSASGTATTTAWHDKPSLSPNVTPPEERTPSPAGSSSTGSSRLDLALLAAQQDNAVEPDVLTGVSYGFAPPDTYTVQTKSGAAQPSCSPFPDVVTLSRAPCQPFHIMAPSWRQLMRLLAQLDTRVEPNLDVIARSKAENHLRAVVQFVKLPYTANTWRTILHLTLDEPLPANLPNRWRYTNGDTTVLPYSYTLGAATPYLVNDANSHFYVIPLSTNSPFPILPISLPNLAMYLRSAMQDSRARKVQNDTSSTMRRLARLVESCYPEEVVGLDRGDRPSRGVGGLIKRVVGRGGNRMSQGNEDVYDIISPFRIDQYTAS